jgi:hypothetical protein
MVRGVRRDGAHLEGESARVPDVNIKNCDSHHTNCFDPLARITIRRSGHRDASPRNQQVSQYRERPARCASRKSPQRARSLFSEVFHALRGDAACA